MMTFWIILIVMVAAGILLLIPALFSKKSMNLEDDRQQDVTIARERMQELKVELEAGTLSRDIYQQTLEELERSLLIDVAEVEAVPEQTSSRIVWAMSIAVLIIVPALGFGMYSLLGSPHHLGVHGPGAPAMAASTQANDGKIPSIEEMVSGLEKKTVEQPDDPNAWYLLGRLYSASERFADSVRAYERLVEVSDRQPTALVVLADSIAMTQDGSLNGRPIELINEALKKGLDTLHCTVDGRAGSSGCQAAH